MSDTAAKTVKVTAYQTTDRGFWTDTIADEFEVPFEVVQIKTGTGGYDEIVFVAADGREVNAIDIQAESLRAGPDDQDPRTPTGPEALHRRVAALMRQYGIADVEATAAFQAEVMAHQAMTHPRETLWLKEDPS